MNNPEHIKELFQKWLDQETNEAENAQLMDWLATAGLQNELLPLLDTAWNMEVKKDVIMQFSKQQIADRILNSSGDNPGTRVAHRVHFLRTAWFRYAAAVILFLAAGAYLWVTNKNKAGQQQLAQNDTSAQTEIGPGGDKAVLILADGTTISLDSAGNGAIASEGGTSIVKLKNGRIAYNIGTLPAKVMWNTMRTPRGGQYQVILPDGTSAWLNASSSIKFPNAFAGNERKISVSGEVYLEVARNKTKPFIVDIEGRSTIQVLGTSFNINAYSNEKTIKTTLVEGSVKVIGGAVNNVGSSGLPAVTLAPGQQSVMFTGQDNAQDARLKVSAITDMAQILAWKNGLFNFNGDDIQAVMRQLERWYDITVTYEGAINPTIFSGEIYRNVPLSDVLEMLQEMGVKFKRKGNNVTVYN